MCFLIAKNGGKNIQKGLSDQRPPEMVFSNKMEYYAAIKTEAAVWMNVGKTLSQQSGPTSLSG